MGSSRVLLVAPVIAGLAAAQYGAVPLPASPAMMPVDACWQAAQCFHLYPYRPDSTRPTEDHPQPDRIIPGFVVPPTPIGLGDPNCPSGDCFPIDPTNICEAYSPNCVPGTSIRWPPLKCDPQHPRCPPNGFLLNPHIPCHPMSGTCPPGGVIVTPEKCTPGGRCPCGCGWYLPPWINGCQGSSGTCSNGFNVTNPPIWPPPFPPDQGYIPGHIWNPNNTCNPSVNPNCESGDIIVPVQPECDARLPGCIAKPNLPDAIPCGCPKDPACPGGEGECLIVKPRPCHPNDSAPEPGCIAVDPIPCAPGTPGCGVGVQYPDPVKPCPIGSLGCSTGFPDVRPPTVKPSDPVIPSKNPRLEYDPNGKVRCSFVQTDHHPDGTIRPEDCPKPVQLKPEYLGNSKFPCTKDDKNPCLGEVVHSWTYWQGWSQNQPPNNFGWTHSLNFAEDVIMTVANFADFNKEWEVRLDGEAIGQTKLGQFRDNKVDTCRGAEDCIKQGSPHGYFIIPRGFHDLQIVLSQSISTGNRWPWVKGAYKINKFCKCAPQFEPSTPSASGSDVPDVSGDVPASNPSSHSAVSSDPPSFDRPPNEQIVIPPAGGPLNEDSVQPAESCSLDNSESISREPSTSTEVSPNPPTADPKPPAMEEVVAPHTGEESPKPASTSKFPCSASDDKPCLGNVVQPWQKRSFQWRPPQYPNTGNDPPAPIVQTIGYPQDTILTVTDAWNKVEHFTLHLDGKPLGTTSMVAFDRSQSCGFNPDSCIERGWSHGYFLIPAGQHELQIEWTRGVGDFRWWLTAVVFTRFNAPCSC